ncbi:unnamed protein product [Peniophora sp. CBMAI 1063]|nr:unnamed protein product [Peniophora sp. CBMAI 1063]
MVRSRSVSSASSSSSQYPCASSSRPSSPSKRSFYDRSSASTSMSSLDACSTPAQRCSCELINESRLKKLYYDHSQSTDGLWHGPLSVAEWTKEFLPSRETPIKLDPDALPDSHDALAFEDYITSSGVCATVFPRAILGVHGKDHTTNTFLSADFSILSRNFALDHNSRVPDTEEAAYTRGRLAAIMRAVAVNSHRTFCFAFVVMPEFARLLRFDHAGIVYSELFPWRTSGDLLHFMATFDRMTPAQRGCDTSVSAVASDSEEAVQAKEILESSNALPDGVQKTSVIPKRHRGPLYLVNVYDDEQKAYHRVVIHRPIKSVEFYVGRMTMGYYGVDLDEGAVVYVKDAWRIASPATAPEASTYRRLNTHSVPYLPGFYFGGDVPEDTSALLHPAPSTSTACPKQNTQSQLFVTDHEEAPRRSRRMHVGLHEHVHHRLLFKKIGRPLKSFQSTLQLCTSLMHALKSHGAAYEDAKILHRDISGGNILIDKDGCGMLIDWDMCVWLENKEEAERTGQKIGTWAYISAGLLMGREQRPHLLRDDLESFVHVLYYHVFRYRPSVPAGSSAQNELLAEIDRVFNTAWRTESGSMAGGGPKSLYLQSSSHFDPAMMRTHIQPLPLCRLMLTVRKAFEPIYTVEPLVCTSGDDAYVALELKELERWKQGFNTAHERLQSSAYLISLFEKMTTDYDRARFQWLSDDGAVDQFDLPPESTNDHSAMAAPSSSGSRKRSAESLGDKVAPLGKVQRVTSSRNVSAGALARAGTRD